MFDDENTVDEKCAKLAQMILASKHVVVHTGAGISTSAGIPDFRYVTPFCKLFKTIKILMTKMFHAANWYISVDQKVYGH